MKIRSIIELVKVVVVGSIVLVALNACSDDPSKSISDVTSDGDKVNILSKKVCTDWSATEAQVERVMSGYEKTFQGDDFMKFRAKDGSHFVSYQFSQGHLSASLALMPKVDDAHASVYGIDGYDYVGATDGAQVYVKSKANTMAFVLDRLIDNVQYVACGFAPVESDAYERLEPVEVVTEQPRQVQTTSMVMVGSFSGVESASSAWFHVGLTPDLTDAKQVRAFFNGSEFSATMSNLTVNSTYYYRASFEADGILYEGDVIAVELQPVRTYEIGDAYPDEANAIGVVCRVSNQGTSGVIVSLDQDYLKWDNDGLFCVDYSARNTIDGSQNNMGSTQPFAKWVKQHGEGWYGPARGELVISKDNLRLINAGLRRLGCREIDGFYWSSTQSNSNQSYAVTVTESSYMGYGNGYYFVNQKDNTHSVRAMKKF